jgi:hypothetical protein
MRNQDLDELLHLRKKGAEDVTAGELSLQGVAGQKDAARTDFKEKEQGCTVSLFGMNSLKKGAV